jgi:hypothetical protein
MAALNSQRVNNENDKRYRFASLLMTPIMSLEIRAAFAITTQVRRNACTSDIKINLRPPLKVSSNRRSFDFIDGTILP